MKNFALTLTILANMTSNYGEGLGNVSSVQKVFRNGKTYAVRSRESMKNAIMVQSGMYEDLQVDVDKKVTQKSVNENLNASNCRALEGGYMNTNADTVIRNSSFYLTDAVSCDEFVNETRFHNNLYLAQTAAKQMGVNLQTHAGDAGLMPYQYEYDKTLKQYSITIDLDKVAYDPNFEQEGSAEEKTARVLLLLEAIEHLTLVVKGNLDNAEPLLVFGGIGPYKTHYFANVVDVKRDELKLHDDLVSRIDDKHYRMGMVKGGNFVNETQIISELKPLSVSQFFALLKEDVKQYYAS